MADSNTVPYIPNPHRVVVPISVAYARHLVKILEGVDSKIAKGAITVLLEMIEGSITKDGASIYSYHHKLSSHDIVNGEIRGLLDALEFYASIYEQKTANVMRAARELILRMLRSPKCYKLSTDRANILAAIDKLVEGDTCETSS